MSKIAWRDYQAGHGPYIPDGERERPLARDLEWNRLIKDMPLHDYIAWRLAGRPGFADMAPHKIREWLRARDAG